MKRNNKFIEFLGKKGFYTAVFTCMFAVIAVAAVISIRNIDAVNKLKQVGESKADPTYGEMDPDGGYDLAAVNANSTKPLSEVVQESEQNKGNDLIQPGNDESQPNTDEKIEENEMTDTEADADANKDEPSEQIQQSEESQSSVEQPPIEQIEQQPADEPAESAGIFDASSMIWPLDGNIVMDYSMDRTVYDKTLDQYRTNPSVCISAPVGTQVKVAGAGVVKSITNDVKTGQTVVIDHGNGWTTTYGQLQDAILVEVGQSVEAGQVIGGVGNPTKYGILLGGHLSFQVDKDEMPQDPKMVLGQ